MKVPGWKTEEIAAQQARERERQRAEREALERQERQLILEAEREAEANTPPAERPELSPAEVVARLERLESQKAGPDGSRRDSQIDGRYRRRDRLRRVREGKAVLAQDERDKEHAKRVSKVTAKLEAQLQETEARRTALVDHHAEALAEIDGTLSDLRQKHRELIRSLPPEESSEDRLQRLELMSQ